MVTLDQVREVAKLICKTSGHPCILVHEKRRTPCTYEDCRMMTIAREALQKAETK